MISRMPRVVYRDLPEGQDWSITSIDDEELIVINAALDDPGRKTALKAAYASLRRNRGPSAGLLLLITGAAAWASEQVRGWVRTPIGSAVTASAITATTVYYGVVHVPLNEPPTTSPPVVTIQESPTPAKPTPSARATRSQSPKPRDDPGSGGENYRPRQTAPPQAEPTPTAKPTRTTPPAPPPTSRAQVEDVAEEEPAASSPPTSASEPSPTETETTEPATPASTSEPPPQTGATENACGGIGLKVKVGDLLGADACLLG